MRVEALETQGICPFVGKDCSITVGRFHTGCDVKKVWCEWVSAKVKKVVRYMGRQ